MALRPIPPLTDLLGLPGLAGLADAPGDLPTVHLVGGAVRDLLRGRPVRDVDLAVEGPLAPVLDLLGGTVTAHGRFGTATLRAPDGVTVDLAQTRRETYARPGALPDVEPADLATDLRRRDFSINAIAIALTGSAAGTLTALDGALDDLDHGFLRILHAGSFRDDPTRLFRLARYAARLSAGEDAGTAALVREAVADPELVWSVGGHRLGAELRLLAAEADPWEALIQAGGRGILGAVDPDLMAPDRVTLAAALRALRRTPEPGDPVAMTLAAAMAHASDPAALAERLGLDAHTRRLAAGAGQLRRIEATLDEPLRPSQLADRLDPLPVELAALLAHRDGGTYLTQLRPQRLQITGEDLIADGVTPGPELGAALQRARHAMLDGRAPDRASQLAAARSAPEPPA